jgi:hypothetical protein
MYSLYRLHASLYVANATSASIYKQGRAFNRASINVDIIVHGTFHRLRHARAFRSTYLQPNTCKNACSIPIFLAPVM